jgi:hypothetical protein
MTLGQSSGYGGRGGQGGGRARRVGGGALLRLTKHAARPRSGAGTAHRGRSTPLSRLSQPPAAPSSPPSSPPTESLAFSSSSIAPSMAGAGTLPGLATPFLSVSTAAAGTVPARGEGSRGRGSAHRPRRRARGCACSARAAAPAAPRAPGAAPPPGRQGSGPPAAYAAHCTPSAHPWLLLRGRPRRRAWGRARGGSEAPTARRSLPRRPSRGPGTRCGLPEPSAPPLGRCAARAWPRRAPALRRREHAAAWGVALVRVGARVVGPLATSELRPCGAGGPGWSAGCHRAPPTPPRRDPAPARPARRRRAAPTRPLPRAPGRRAHETKPQMILFKHNTCSRPAVLQPGRHARSLLSTPKSNRRGGVNARGRAGGGARAPPRRPARAPPRGVGCV